METISLAALFDSTAPRQALAAADVIIAVDIHSNRERTVFGTPAFEETAVMGRPSAMQTVKVTIDESAGDMEKLLALVKILKGLRSAPSET